MYAIPVRNELQQRQEYVFGRYLGLDVWYVFCSYLGDFVKWDVLHGSNFIMGGWAIRAGRLIDEWHKSVDDWSRSLDE